MDLKINNDYTSSFATDVLVFFFKDFLGFVGFLSNKWNKYFIHFVFFEKFLPSDAGDIPAPFNCVS